MCFNPALGVGVLKRSVSYTVVLCPYCVQSHAEFVSELTEEHERHAREIEAKYHEKLRALQAQNDLRRKTELQELEERKSTQVITITQFVSVIHHNRRQIISCICVLQLQFDFDSTAVRLLNKVH